MRDAAAIIEILAEHVSDERLARMRAVAARRTRHLGALCERFHDLHNVAACMRTADALGLQAVHVVHDPADATAERRPPRDLTLARAVSLASERWVDRVDHEALDDALDALLAEGHRLVAAAPGGRGTRLPPDELPLDRPLTVLFGNERDGLSERAIARAELTVAVPMRGFVQSLNVSVAFAIIMGRLRDRLEERFAADPTARSSFAFRGAGAWLLSAAEQEALVARWLRASVPHAERILEHAGSAATR